MTSSMRVNRHLLRCLFLLLVLTGIASAQSGRGWMEGRVVGKSDSPSSLSGATVELIGHRGNPRLKSVKLTTKADGKGDYSLKGIPYGDYTLLVSAPGYITYQIGIYIPPDTQTQLHIKLRKK
jgi:Carboxypeptidase regulatory-like domain